MLRVAVVILGALAALLILSQLVMGLMLANGQASTALLASHKHTGYLAVVVVLSYIGLSLAVILSAPKSSTT